MKTEADGQGVIDGVETKSETKKKLVTAEKKRWREIYTDTHKELSELAKVLADKGTFHSLAVLEMGMAAMRGMQEINRKALNRGTVTISLKGKLDKCSVRAKYQQPHVEEGANVGTLAI